MNTNLYRVLILLCCLLVQRPAPAAGIEIRSAASRLVGDSYLLDADLAFSFDPEVVEALEHGVAITIDIIIVVKRVRNWLWDPKIKRETISYRLEQHPLSNLYLVTEISSDIKRQFHTLPEALAYLSNIEGRFLVKQSALAVDAKYIGTIKAKVNTGALPAVIRPEAVVSKKWQLDSPWREWVIKE